MWSERNITRVYQKGDIIIKEGESGKEMFIIQSGSVNVFKGEGHSRILLASLDRADFFGDMAILENSSRSATVIAKEETCLVVLNLGNFLLKIKKDPTFAFSLMQKMSNRIRILDETICKMIERPETIRSDAINAVAKVEYLKETKS